MPDPAVPHGRSRGHGSGSLRQGSTDGWRTAGQRVSALLVAAGLSVVALVAGCSTGAGDGAAAASCPAPVVAPASQLALLPAGLVFDGIGPVTRVVSTDGHVTVRAVTTLPLEESTVAIQDAVTAAGYRPAGMDNEGFEAEVFFTAGAYAAGQAIVRQGTCAAQWDVDLVLIDPDAVPSPGATPSPTTSPSAG